MKIRYLLMLLTMPCTVSALKIVNDTIYHDTVSVYFNGKQLWGDTDLGPGGSTTYPACGKKIKVTSSEPNGASSTKEVSCWKLGVTATLKFKNSKFYWVWSE